MAIQFSPNVARGNRNVGSSPQTNTNTNVINGNGNTVTNNNTNQIDQSVTRTNNSVSFNAGDTVSANIPMAPNFASGAGNAAAAGGGCGCSAANGASNAGGPAGGQDIFAMMKQILAAFAQNMAGNATPGGGAQNQMQSFGGCGCA